MIYSFPSLLSFPCVVFTLYLHRPRKYNSSYVWHPSAMLKTLLLYFQTRSRINKAKLSAFEKRKSLEKATRLSYEKQLRRRSNTGKAKSFSRLNHCFLKGKHQKSSFWGARKVCSLWNCVVKKHCKASNDKWFSFNYFNYRTDVFLFVIWPRNAFCFALSIG